jgi:hypothetical protein
MPVNVKEKDPAAVALGRKGGRKGGPARAASLTPEQRSESARNAVRARWAKAKGDSGSTIHKSKKMGIEKVSRSREEVTSEAAPATALLDTSKKALHICLKRIKDAKNESDLRRLTEELQRIVFHKQYRNA